MAGERNRALFLLREWGDMAALQARHYHRLYSMGRQMLHEAESDALRRQILADLKGISYYSRDCQTAMEVAATFFDYIMLISWDGDVPALMQRFLSQMPTGWESTDAQRYTFITVANELSTQRKD